MKYKNINEAKVNVRKIAATIAGNIDISQVMYEGVMDYFNGDPMAFEEAEQAGLMPALIKQLKSELR